MDLQWWNFPLVITVAAAFATVAFGPSESAESIPDLSGIWEHANPGFEPLASGPTALINRSRRPNGTGDGLKLTGDYTNPILKPEAAEIVKKHGERALNMGDPNPHNQCWLEGPPFVFTNHPNEIVQTRDKVVILYQDNSQVRHVRMNQPHPAQVTPSWYGDSVGHYEGDTLVVDTVGIKVGPFSMIDRFGTPYSEALHLVERFRLIDREAANLVMARNERENGRIGPEGGGGRVDPNDTGKGLQIQFTVEDPNIFTAPWSATVTYRRNVEPWQERVCAENLRNYGVAEDPKVPVANRPDF
jgi:hypothetical protein